MSVRSPSIERVVRALTEFGIETEVHELPDSTRSAADAARAIGCTAAQIVKSLVFRGSTTGRAILVLVSGANRVSEAKIATIVGEPVEKADAAFVRERTGFAIGGVPPLGHEGPTITVGDTDLFSHPRVWAAAGTPHAVFALDRSHLTKLTDQWVDVTDDQPECPT